jgi:hypothetical protein
MKNPNFVAIHKQASKNLEDSLRHYDEAQGVQVKEFVLLKLQASIFQYDICNEMVGYMRNKPVGFAASVALKGLVLRLYEYDDLINTTLIPRMIKLATHRGVAFDKSKVKALRTEWKTELNRLKRWSSFRNQVAGHYGKDLNIQVSLLKDLDKDEVMTVTVAFLSYNMSLLVGLRDIGKGIATDN